MKSSTRIFLIALAELMEEHEVEWISADDEWQGYAECGQDIQIRIEHKTDYSYDPGFGSLMSPERIREELSKGE